MLSSAAADVDGNGMIVIYILMIGGIFVSALGLAWIFSHPPVQDEQESQQDSPTNGGASYRHTN